MLVFTLIQMHTTEVTSKTNLKEKEKTILILRFDINSNATDNYTN